MVLDKKRMILIGLIVIAFLFLGYEIFRLVSDGDVRPMAESTHVAAVSAPASSAMPKAPTATNAHATASEGNVQPAELTQPPLVKDQEAYMQLMSEYTIAKMRHQLLDEQAAIAQAQERIHRLQGGTGGDNGYVSDSVALTSPDRGIQLSYLDKQNGQWSATINQNGQYQAVNAGMDLANGAKVIAVNQHGVLITSAKGQREQITFSGIQPVLAIQKSSASVLPVVHSPRVKPTASAVLPSHVHVQHHVKTIAPQAALTFPVLSKELKDTLPKQASLSVPPVTKQIKAKPKAKTEEAALTFPILSKALQATLPKQARLSAPTEVQQNHVTHPVTSGKKQPVMTLKKSTLKPTTKPKTKMKPASVFPKHASLSAPAVGKHDTVALAAPLSDYLVHIHGPYSADEQAVLAMNKKDYTIQLIASYHKQTVENFADQQMLGYKTYTFRVTNHDKPWYVLSFGHYKTWKAARAALASMPPHIKIQGPWVRQVNGIQRDLRLRTKPA